MIPLKSFYFLRHGETDWNFEHKTMGSQDIPLNDRGFSQAVEAGERLQNDSIRTIISSPLLRARKTADIVSSYVRAPVLEITELQEACLGEREGKLKGDGLWFNVWHKGHEIKNAEKYTDFAKRVRRGMEKALGHKGPVLIVSHGGVYEAIREILGLPMTDLGNGELIFHHPPVHPTHLWNVYPLFDDGFCH